MAIQFKCSCGKVVSAPDANAGKKGKCPGCGAVITIPAKAGASGSKAPPAAAPPAPAPAPAPAAPAPAAAAPQPYASPQSGLPQPGPAWPQQAPGRLRMASYQPAAKGGTFSFQNAPPEMLASQVAAFFAQRGYRLESGTPFDGVYGKGSDLMRILLGGFVQRYKFQVTIQVQPPWVWLHLAKGMSGAMGGLLGYSAVNRESDQVLQGLQMIFA